MDELPSDSVAEIFGTSVRQVREKRGWSQSELARRMQQIGWEKYSQVAVSRTEEGTRTVRLDEAFALADALQCRIADLMTPDRTAQALREDSAAVRRAAYVVNDAIEDYFYAKAILQKTVDEAEDRIQNGEPLPEALYREIKGALVVARFDLTLNYPDYAEDPSRGDD